MGKKAKMLDPNAPKKILTPGNLWAYALGLMGINLAIGLVNSYQAEFFNKMLGANLMIIAAIILVSKFISIVADFVIGHLIDNAKFKSGKMRPWIMISAFPLAVVTMLSFAAFRFPDTQAGQVGMYIYITIICIFWNISMTLADIPSQGILALLSPDGNERNGAAGLGNTLKSVALACSGVFATVILMAFGKKALDTVTYLVLAGVLCGLGLIFQVLMFFKTKENVKSEVQSTSFKEMFRELKTNKQILIVFLTYILGFGRNIALGIAVQATYILMRDGVDLSFLSFLGFSGRLYGDGISWAIGITSAVSSMITIVFNAAINKKLGEKRYFIYAGFYGFVVALACTLAYTLSPAGSFARGFGAILIYQFVFGFAYGPNGFLPMVMTSDIVDYQEWKTGKRTEGAQFAILSLSNKLSNGLSVAIGIFLMGAIGFSAAKANTYIEGDVSQISEYITDSMQNKAWIIYFFLPGLCMLLSSILMFFYKIDEKTKVQMRAELAERRAKAAQETQEGSEETVSEDAPVQELAEEKEEAIEEQVEEEKKDEE